MTKEDEEENEIPPTGDELYIKLRLSSGKDLKMTVYTSDTVLKVKKKLQKLEAVEPSKQRWFYAGKMLTDKTTIAEAKIPKGYVVQVILPQPTPVENQKLMYKFDNVVEFLMLQLFNNKYTKESYFLSKTNKEHFLL